MKMATNRKFYEEIIEVTKKRDVSLTPFEKEFISSMRTQYEMSISLTKNQRQTLDKIHSKVLK